MKQIKVTVGTNRVGSDTTRTFEIEDNATEEKINEIAWETAMDMINFTWEEIN